MENQNGENRRTLLLEDLDGEKREWLLELATHGKRLVDLLEPLKEHGIEVSLSTLTRFVRRHREQQALEAGKEMKGTVEELVKRGQGEEFRKGTIELVRQRLYEQALLTNSAEQTQKIYEELLREGAKLKELELAGRRLALAEEQARLQGLRLKLDLERQRKKAQIESALVEGTKIEGQGVAGELGAPGGETFTEAHKGNEERERRLLALLRDLAGILNRGGSVEDKVFEARVRLAAEAGLLEEGL